MEGRGDRTEVIPEPGDEMRLSITRLGGGHQKEPTQPRRDGSLLPGVQEGLHRGEDPGKSRMVRPSRPREVRREIHEEIVEERVVGRVIHGERSGKISHGIVNSQE
jgi:hypothetical protein